MTNYFIKFIHKRNDRGWFKDSGTQCNTISEYTELYSGPDYQIYIKYAFMIKYWFLALFYGLAIPVVFPITFFALFN